MEAIRHPVNHRPWSEAVFVGHFRLATVTDGQVRHLMGSTFVLNFVVWRPRLVRSAHAGRQWTPGRGPDRRHHRRVAVHELWGVSLPSQEPDADPGTTDSIPTELPRSAAYVTCTWLFGTYTWTSLGLGWKDDWMPLRCPIRWAARSGTGHDRAGPGRHRWCSRRSVGSPAGPLTPVTGPLASASTVVPT